MTVLNDANAKTPMIVGHHVRLSLPRCAPRIDIEARQQGDEQMCHVPLYVFDGGTQADVINAENCFINVFFPCLGSLWYERIVASARL